MSGGRTRSGPGHPERWESYSLFYEATTSERFFENERNLGLTILSQFPSLTPVRAVRGTDTRGPASRAGHESFKSALLCARAMRSVETSTSSNRLSRIHRTLELERSGAEQEINNTPLMGLEPVQFDRRHRPQV